jgi:hypothetical protein
VAATAPPQLILDAAEGDKLAAVRSLARVMDTAIELPGGIKVGLDALLGLLPGVGDAISSAVGGYIVMIAAQMGVPKAVIWRMVMNLGVDAVVGVVPFAGDLLDVAWKANSKNVRLLEQSLADPKAARRSSTWMLVWLALAVVLLAVGSAVVTWLIIRAVTS